MLRHPIIRAACHTAVFLAAVVLAAVFLTRTARADTDSPWRKLADRVFHQVANNVDMPNALIPMTMMEDADGFLWLGGTAGLVRWDGYEFRDYRAEPARPDGLRDADTWTLYRDARQQLWVGTVEGGLARYDAAQDRLICVKLVHASCGTQRVGAIDGDGNGGIWVASSAGLYRLDAAGNVAGEFHPLPGRPGSLPDDDVLAVLHDRNGGLWIGTRYGVAHSASGAGNFVAFPLTATAVAVTRMMQDSAGRIWIGTRQHGAFEIDADRATVHAISGTASDGNGETAAEITSLLEMAPGEIWIARYGRGIIEVDAATLATRGITHSPFVPNGLDGDSVQSLYRDRAGIVWVGTEDGLSQYSAAAPGIMTFFGNRDRRDGLPGESLMAIFAAPDGSLWAGLQGDGYAVLDSAHGRRATGLPGRRVFAIAPAPPGGPAGGVLLGTDGGLFLADARGQTVQRVMVPGLPGAVDIRALRTVADTVWMAARDGGLWGLRIGADGTAVVRRHETTPRLTNAVVDVIAPAPDGRLALGTNSGLNLLDPVSGAIEQIPPDPSRPGGLATGSLVGMATDRQGRLWVSTPNGIDILVGRDSRGRAVFRALGVADGLPNPSVDSLAVDRLGFVWAGTDNGLAMIDPNNFSIRRLQRADGLAITNFWNDSVAQTPTGELVFGGIGGMVMVRPGAAAAWTYRPPVVITAVRIGGETVKVPGKQAAPLVVAPAKNSLAVEFAALDFSLPGQNRYAYRLDGFDTGWIDTDAAHRVASYTNLPPGEYTLRLRGSNRDGRWSEPETTLPVRVLPAWYQTLAFRLAVAGCATIMLALLLRGWTAMLRGRQRELERQVAERTGQLSESQLQLRRANAELEARVAERTSALAATEARFRAWFDNAEDGVFVVQVAAGGHFVYEAVNTAMERIFGVPAASFAGHSPQEVFTAESARIVLGHYRAATLGEPIQFETRVTIEGMDRTLDTWIVPLRNPSNLRVERLIGAARDVTQRRALEARLAQSEKLQALGGLAGGIAHDFNNILQAVAGAAVLIQQHSDDQTKVNRLAQSTISAAERGASIARRLLAFARSDELRVEPVATAEVLDGVCDVLTHTLGSAIAVRTQFAAALPNLLADRGQLETALVNLGTNARDAMPRGGTLTLSAASEWVLPGTAHAAGLAAGPYVLISVTDTGSGMDAATLSRAIEPFFTTKPPGQGTGLGLALVKGFAEQSGGGMTIESAPGVGTTVRLWLRQARPDMVPQPLESAPARRPANASARVFVVDDDELVRETIAAGLGGAGFSVVAAASGAEAVEMMQSAAMPDALVCDLSMPGMNGIETIKRARELLPGLPCFLLTGYAGERAALETGDAFTLLRKPISANALSAQIEASLAAARA